MKESNIRTAIITAVLTGVFTVVAGLSTYYVTTKEPELKYSIVGGPVLSGATGSKRIFVVEVRNSGRKEVSATLIQLALEGGDLSEITTEASPGVRLTETRTQQRVDIQVDTLNPSETIKASFLASLPSPKAEPRVLVRAPGVRAIAQPEKPDGIFSGSTGFTLTAATLAAALSSFLLASRAFRRSLRVVSSLDQCEVSSLDQCEIGSYVCGACGLYAEADRLRFGGSEITYRGIADFLGHHALMAPPEERVKHETALRALLLEESMSSRSFESIRAAIGRIGGTDLSDAEFQDLRNRAVMEGANPVLWRKVVEEYAQARLEQFKA